LLSAGCAGTHIEPTFSPGCLSMRCEKRAKQVLQHVVEELSVRNDPFLKLIFASHQTLTHVAREYAISRE
jgi:hypothetical protein